MPFPVKSVPIEKVLKEWTLHNDAVILDVRTSEEVKRQPGTVLARHLDYLHSDFEQHLNTLDRLVPYYLYCDTGKRSRLAAEMMAERGFTLVAWMEGGQEALQKFLEVHGDPGLCPF